MNKSLTSSADGSLPNDPPVPVDMNNQATTMLNLFTQMLLMQQRSQLQQQQQKQQANEPPPATVSSVIDDVSMIYCNDC